MPECGELRTGDRTGWVAGLGLLLLAVVGLAPLILEAFPREPVSAYDNPLLGYTTKALTVVLLGAAIPMGTIVEHRGFPSRTIAGEQGRGGLAARMMGLAALAAVMTAWHYIAVDIQPKPAEWQRELYYDILNQNREHDDGHYRVPHQFRPLPYGFARSLELLTGDRIFACLAYRWFFAYWFLWGAYAFARHYHAQRGALITLVPIALLYPFSIAFYKGQLTDPMSHALFIVSLMCVVQDRFLLLAASLVLGIMAKETVVIVVPAYLLHNWYTGRPLPRALLRTTALGVICIMAFLATRLPLEGWSLNNQSMNGNEQSMVTSNLLTADWADRLGLEEPLYHSSVPIWQNYLQPLLFVGVFVPLILWNWRQIDIGLRCLFLTLTPLLLFSSLYYSWLYESRNYLPLVPMLATMALPAHRQES